MITEEQMAELKKIVLEQFNATKNAASRERAEKFLTDGVISTALYPDVDIRDRQAWADRGARSHERYLNGFLFFTDWYGTVLQDADKKEHSSAAAIEIIRAWITSNRDPSNCARMAFHDETTAQRLINLLQLDTYIAPRSEERRVGKECPV